MNAGQIALSQHKYLFMAVQFKKGEKNMLNVNTTHRIKCVGPGKEVTTRSRLGY